jgi:transposase-like protein
VVKSILEVIFKQHAQELLIHTKVHCPNCKEDYEIFSSKGVLPERKDYLTGRCAKCNTDFYYKRGRSWFECFALSDTNKENIKEGDKNEENN